MEFLKKNRKNYCSINVHVHGFFFYICLLLMHETVFGFVAVTVGTRAHLSCLVWMHQKKKQSLVLSWNTMTRLIRPISLLFASSFHIDIIASTNKVRSRRVYLGTWALYNMWRIWFAFYISKIKFAYRGEWESLQHAKRKRHVKKSFTWHRNG